MIKLVIVAVICFVMALAASTGVTVMRSPARVAAADSSVVADSVLRAAPSGVATAASRDVIHDSSGGPSAPDWESGPTALQLAAAVPHTPDVVRPSTAPAVKLPPDFGHVAKILVNMKPAESAAILAYLGDEQVEGVLRALGPRQAAGVLAAIPTERAAQLSRRLLVPPPGEQKP